MRLGMHLVVTLQGEIGCSVGGSTGYESES